MELQLIKKEITGIGKGLVCVWCGFCPFSLRFTEQQILFNWILMVPREK